DRPADRHRPARDHRAFPRSRWQHHRLISTAEWRYALTLRSRPTHAVARSAGVPRPAGHGGLRGAALARLVGVRAPRRAASARRRVLVSEEPWPRRTFGADWEDYRARVPRWLPRLRKS